MRVLKVICSRHAPSAGLPVYQEAAKYDLPVLFHAGILWDGLESGKYNRPCEFECLQEVYGLRFALAHIAWPWTDECVALFGKLQNGCRSYGRKLDFYIDDSPGTPDIFRRQVFRNFAFIGYDLTDKLIFGVDSNVHNYNWEWGKYMLDFDREMFADLNEEFKTFNGYLAVESFKDGGERPDLNRLFENSIHKNLLRFLGEI
jgi:predicted TIM-barrel fold metal-dependent hydrolase